MDEGDMHHCTRFVHSDGLNSPNIGIVNGNIRRPESVFALVRLSKKWIGAGIILFGGRWRW